MDLAVLSHDSPAPLRPRVAVDAMGGDHAPQEVVAGALDWARVHDDTDLIPSCPRRAGDRLSAQGSWRLRNLSASWAARFTGS